MYIASPLLQRKLSDLSAVLMEKNLKSRVSEKEFPSFWGTFQMTTSTSETDPNHQQLFPARTAVKN
jgi:hypothetical protein